MRNISFFLTQTQIIAQTKTVTRRLRWLSMKPETKLQPVVKGQGIPKGEKIQKLGGAIIVKKVTHESLNAITQAECDKEGFSSYSPDQFVAMFCKHNKCEPSTMVTRIEFGYI